MGLSASQARLLSITARLSDNEMHSQQIANAKVNLAGKTQEASREYINSLDAQKLVYTMYDDKGNSTNVKLTPAVMYSYSPLKNQYGISNNVGQLLISETDANNYKNSKNLKEFLEKYCSDDQMKINPLWTSLKEQKAEYEKNKEAYQNQQIESAQGLDKIAKILDPSATSAFETNAGKYVVNDDYSYNFVLKDPSNPNSDIFVNADAINNKINTEKLNIQNQNKIITNKNAELNSMQEPKRYNYLLEYWEDTISPGLQAKIDDTTYDRIVTPELLEIGSLDDSNKETQIKEFARDIQKAVFIHNDNNYNLYKPDIPKNKSKMYADMQNLGSDVYDAEDPNSGKGIAFTVADVFKFQFKYTDIRYQQYSDGSHYEEQWDNNKITFKAVSDVSNIPTTGTTLLFKVQRQLHEKNTDPMTGQETDVPVETSNMLHYGESYRGDYRSILASLLDPDTAFQGSYEAVRYIINTDGSTKKDTRLVYISNRTDDIYDESGNYIPSTNGVDDSGKFVYQRVYKDGECPELIKKAQEIIKNNTSLKNKILNLLADAQDDPNVGDLNDDAEIKGIMEKNDYNVIGAYPYWYVRGSSNANDNGYYYLTSNNYGRFLEIMDELDDRNNDDYLIYVTDKKVNGETVMNGDQIATKGLATLMYEEEVENKYVTTFNRYAANIVNKGKEDFTELEDNDEYNEWLAKTEAGLAFKDELAKGVYDEFIQGYKDWIRTLSAKLNKYAGLAEAQNTDQMLQSWLSNGYLDTSDSKIQEILKTKHDVGSSKGEDIFDYTESNGTFNLKGIKKYSVGNQNVNFWSFESMQAIYKLYEAAKVGYTKKQTELQSDINNAQTSINNSNSNISILSQYDDLLAQYNDALDMLKRLDMFNETLDDQIRVTPEMVYDDGKTEVNWYTNLWHRINGESDENVNVDDSGNLILDSTYGKYWKILNDSDYKSSAWLQYALAQGIVTLEQVQVMEDVEDDTGLTTTKWMSKIYSSCVDIKTVDDEAAIAIAEAKYTRKLNEIEAEDKKLDTEIKKLDTEHNALQTEYQSIKDIISKNTERSFKAFS